MKFWEIVVINENIPSAFSNCLTNFHLMKLSFDVNNNSRMIHVKKISSISYKGQHYFSQGFNSKFEIKIR